MSSEERKQILQMVEAGKITADEALALIKELEEDGAVEHAAVPATPELDRTAAQARALWQVPLWIGMAVTVLAALAIYSVMMGAGYSFWFYCLWLPFLLGVLLMALAAWSRTARWLFVNVDRSRSPDGPRRIFLGFPLPLNLVGWFLRTFGSYIQGLRGTNVDEVVEAISMAKTTDNPLIVNVDDGGDGERVQVFIG
jgi:hypothetical protein